MLPAVFQGRSHLWQFHSDSQFFTYLPDHNSFNFHHVSLYFDLGVAGLKFRKFVKGIKNEVLQITMERFPDLAGVIENLYAVNEEFQDICEDYVLCLNTIHKIKSGNPPEKKKYLREYEEALDGLEEELFSIIKKDKSSHIQR